MATEIAEIQSQDSIQDIKQSDGGCRPNAQTRREARSAGTRAMPQGVCSAETSSGATRGPGARALRSCGRARSTCLTETDYAVAGVAAIEYS